MTERDFRRLSLAYYLRLRRGGLTRLGARELVGTLVNAANDIDLFGIHRDLETLDAIRRAVGSVGAALGSEDDTTRTRARRGLPHVLKAEEAIAGWIQYNTRRVAHEGDR